MPMDVIGLALVVTVSAVATFYCWRRIWQSDDALFFKIFFSTVSAVPVLGPFLYFFCDMPRSTLPHAQRNPLKPKMSAVMRYWTEREHLFLLGAGCIFAALAVVAYWI